MNEPQLTISRIGDNPSVIGTDDKFTGHARIDMHFAGNEPFRSTAATVTFAPGARTAWHTHPLGQQLIITSGIGWVQQEGSAKQEVKAGDVVWFPPHIKHWHGATSDHGMSHIAVQEALDGKTVDWLENVTEDQYSNS